MPDDNLRGRYRRDFTRDPIPGRSPARPQPAHQPAPHSAQSKSDPHLPSLKEIEASKHKHRKVKNKRRSLKYFFWFLLIVVLLAGLAGGGYFYLKQNKPEKRIPVKIKQQASIPILYPGKLPAGYKVVEQSFNVSPGGIIAYYAEDDLGHRLIFNVEARPANFDFEAFYSKSMVNVTRFTTPLGQAAVGTANNRLLGSLATTKSWVIVSGNSKAVTADQIHTALSQMQQLN